LFCTTRFRIVSFPCDYTHDTRTWCYTRTRNLLFYILSSKKLWDQPVKNKVNTKSFFYIRSRSNAKFSFTLSDMKVFKRTVKFEILSMHRTKSYFYSTNLNKYDQGIIYRIGFISPLYPSRKTSEQNVRSVVIHNPTTFATYTH
jgi:hypothetical protein